MAEDSRVSEFVDRNRDAAKSHEAIPLLKDTLFKNGPDPRGNIVIVSCFDCRIQPAQYFGVKASEANILNNAGGRVDADALRSLYVLDSIAGVSTVIIVHHTDCGLTHGDDDHIRGKLKKKAPENGPEIDRMTFGEIKDLYQSVVDDMQIVKASPYLQHLKVLGFVFDITNGTVEEVKLH